MKRASLVAGAAMVSTVLFAGPVWAQGAPQTVRIERVDVQKLAAGYRSSKIVGSPVVNDANEKIGDVDDLLVEPSDKVLFAVLSVGGFLGMGERLGRRAIRQPADRRQQSDAAGRYEGRAQRTARV